MKERFEKLREQLHKSIEINGINSEQTKKISEKFDKLINSYYENEKQYREDNMMNIKYKASMCQLRKITKEYGNFPSVEEWNKFAKEQNLLSSESIKYISGINWHDLRNRINIEL